MKPVVRNHSGLFVCTALLSGIGIVLHPVSRSHTLLRVELYGVDGDGSNVGAGAGGITNHAIRYTSTPQMITPG